MKHKSTHADWRTKAPSQETSPRPFDWPGEIQDGHGNRYRFEIRTPSESRPDLFCIQLHHLGDGYAALFVFGERTKGMMELADIEVFPVHSGNGLGFRLLQLIEGFARSRGCIKMTGIARAREPWFTKEQLAAWYRKRGYVLFRKQRMGADYVAHIEKRPQKTSALRVRRCAVSHPL